MKGNIGQRESSLHRCRCCCCRRKRIANDDDEEEEEDDGRPSRSGNARTLHWMVNIQNCITPMIY